jgi:hypothetical protein
MDAVEVATDDEDLRNGGKLVPAMRVGHLPAEPVDAGRQSQARSVVSGCRQPGKRSGQRVGLIPPGVMPHFQGLMHVHQASAISRGAEDHKPGFEKAG